MKKFDRRLNEALSFMGKNEEQKKEIKEMMKEIGTRLELYQSRKEEFEVYNFEEKANKVKNKAEYEYLIRKYGNEIRELRGKENGTSNEITKLKIKIKDLQGKLENVTSEININQKQVYGHLDDTTLDTTFEEDFLNVSVTLSQDEK